MRIFPVNNSLGNITHLEKRLCLVEKVSAINIALIRRSLFGFYIQREITSKNSFSTLILLIKERCRLMFSSNSNTIKDNHIIVY